MRYRRPQAAVLASRLRERRRFMQVVADPATASTIFVTTATDVVGMGLMLLLATVLVL